MTECGCSSHGGFLTAKGLKEAAQRELGFTEVLAVDESLLYLDKVVSVSGARRDETHWPADEVIDEQHRRFLDEVA